MVCSDHGFAPYYRSFHVNAWLRELGYLVLRDGVRPILRAGSRHQCAFRPMKPTQWFRSSTAMNKTFGCSLFGEAALASR